MFLPTHSATRWHHTLRIISDALGIISDALGIISDALGIISGAPPRVLTTKKEKTKLS